MMQAQARSVDTALGPARSIPLPGVVHQTLLGASAVQDHLLAPRVKRKDHGVARGWPVLAQQRPARSVPRPEVVEPASAVASAEHQRHAAFVVEGHGVSAADIWSRGRLREECRLLVEEQRGKEWEESAHSLSWLTAYAQPADGNARM